MIDWQNLSILHEDGSLLEGRVSFQAILFEGSNDIAFQYKTLEGPRSYGESATVGLQNAARTLMGLSTTLVTVASQSMP